MKQPFKVSLLDKAIGSIAPTYALRRMASRMALHQFSFDAARATHQRSQAPQNINPNDFQKQRDRLQLMREAEDIENNFAPAKTLNRKYAMYVAPVGYNAQTGDSGLDRDVEEYLNVEWFPYTDVTGRYNFFDQLQFGVIGKNRAGDYGWAYMRPGFEEGMDEEDIVKLPLRIQSVEADRIGGVYQQVVSERYVAGLIIGDYGEVTHYRVFRRNMVVGQYVDPVDIPAEQFIHYTDPLRIDMYRGVSMLDTASMPLRDLYEWFEFLKAKAKIAAALTVFTNSNGAQIGNGAMDPYSSNQFANQQAGLSQDIHFGQINHLPMGGAIEFPDTTAPGTESQYLILMLMKFCAMSYNLPYSFALDATEMGGVSSRLESEQARAEFERGQKVLQPKATQMKNAGLIDAVAKGRFPAKYAEKIMRGRFSYRAHPTPDIGKEATANVSLYQNGLLNPLAYWSGQAMDPETTAEDMSRWVSIKKKAAAKYGNTPEEVFGLGPIVPGTQDTSSEGDGSTPGDDPKEDSPTPPDESELKQFKFTKAELTAFKKLTPKQKMTKNRENLVALWKAIQDELGYEPQRAWAAAYKIVADGYFKPSRLPKSS